jgi:hypothetical protein
MVFATEEGLLFFGEEGRGSEKFGREFRLGGHRPK